MAQRTALHLLRLWLRLRRWLRCRLSGARIRSGARCRARLGEMEPANWNLLGNYMKSANKNVMSKDLKLDKIGDIETLHYPLKCRGDIDLNWKILLAFRLSDTKRSGRCFWRKNNTDNVWSHMDMGPANTDQWMHPSSNRTGLMRIRGICLLTLLVPNLLSSLCNNALTCIYSKQILNMCVYCENVRLSMENWPIWLHTVHQCLYILFNLAVSNGQIG